MSNGPAGEQPPKAGGHFVVVNDAPLRCSFGADECLLHVTAGNTLIENELAATIDDTTPSNIPGFGACTAIGSCAPNLSKWSPGFAFYSPRDGRPGVPEVACCKCSHGGVVRILSPGQSTKTEGGALR